MFKLNIRLMATTAGSVECHWQRKSKIRYRRSLVSKLNVFDTTLDVYGSIFLHDRYSYFDTPIKIRNGGDQYRKHSTIDIEFVLIWYGTCRFLKISFLYFNTFYASYYNIILITIL